MTGTAAASMKSNASKLYEALQTKTAPAAGGKALAGIWEDDLRIVKMAGAKSMADIFGHKDIGDNAPYVRSLNFGSKADCGMLPDDTRLRLFELKKLINAAELQAQIETRNLNPSAAAIMATPVYKNFLEPALKAFNVTDFSGFIQLVNTRFYFEEFEIALLVGDLFDQLTMESSTMSMKGILGRMFGLLETDSATFTAQANTQDDVPVSAKNNVVHAQITEDLNQDSAPAVIDKMRKEVVQGVARAEDRSYLDGDDSVAHMDADVTAATDFRKAWKGIRKLGLDNSANGSVYDHAGDAPSKELFRQLLKKAGRFASDKSDLAWIIGSTLGNDLVSGAIPELFTAFAFGGPASNVTGQVPPVFGIKAYESEYVREDLAATGVYTAAGQTKTWCALVKKSRMMRFLRQPIRVWAAPALPSSDLMLMSAKKRHSFAAIKQSAEEKSIIIGIDIETVS
jgi:hypothetical protein